MTFFELLYYLGYSIKKRYALKNQKRLPHKVVSIGNITLGGTGKTPATIALAEEANKMGFKPCILTRGYKGNAKDPCFVSIGEEPLLEEYQAGDEALLMAEKLKRIPIIKGKNRYKAGMFALSSLPLALCPDLFILDDGFQHWGLFRDKNILLIDSTNPFGNRKLLPLGPLREPICAISRSDVIVITKTDEVRNQKSKVKSLVEEIKKYNSKASIFFAGHRPSIFKTMTGEVFSLDWVRNKKFFGFCSIGNPKSFKETLLSVDTELIGFKTFRDHYRYSHDDIQAITGISKRYGTDWIVTTEKDIMRLKKLAVPQNIVALVIKFMIDEEFYDEVLGFKHETCNL
jgi:tetraacyldisaccharide 4'-kinase